MSEKIKNIDLQAEKENGKHTTQLAAGHKKHNKTHPHHSVWNNHSVLASPIGSSARLRGAMPSRMRESIVCSGVSAG